MLVNDSTPIAMLTVGQLKDVLGGNVTLVSNERRYEYGLRGIAKIFGCSVPTAQRIKTSGVIDGAIVQAGRKIIIDVDLAIELAGRKKKSGSK